MDFRSVLQPGDLFASYWLDDHLMIAIGDCDGIHTVHSAVIPDLRPMIATFQSQMTRAEHYVGFVAERFRQAEWPQHVTPAEPLAQILDTLTPALVPPCLLEKVLNGSYRRLLLMPDGILHAVPFHMLLQRAPARTWPQLLPGGVIYSPSASSYVYACQKRHREPPRRAVVLLGDAQSESMRREAAEIAWQMPLEASIVSDMRELQSLSGQIDLLYVITHGRSAASCAPDETGARGWSLLFDNGALDAGDFFNERVKLSRGAVVVLSACSLGDVLAGPVHELEAFVQALFYAGASSVLAARWPVLEPCSRYVFTTTLATALTDRLPLGVAFTDALTRASGMPELTQYLSSPDAAPFFWGPFALFGCGD